MWEKELREGIREGHAKIVSSVEGMNSKGMLFPKAHIFKWTKGQENKSWAILSNL